MENSLKSLQSIADLYEEELKDVVVYPTTYNLLCKLILPPVDEKDGGIKMKSGVIIPSSYTFTNRDAGYENKRIVKEQGKIHLAEVLKVGSKCELKVKEGDMVRIVSSPVEEIIDEFASKILGYPAAFISTTIVIGLLKRNILNGGNTDSTGDCLDRIKVE